MRASLSTPALAIVCASCAVAHAPPPSPAPPSAPATSTAPTRPATNYSQIERDIMHLVNVERMKNRLDTLRWNPQLDKAAKIQAVEMAAEHKMAHDLPGAQYPTLKDRISFAGYSYRHIAENIAFGYPNATYTVQAWMSSAGHRANILDRVSYETGIGVARSKSGELYFAQVFGARLY